MEAVNLHDTFKLSSDRNFACLITALQDDQHDGIDNVICMTVTALESDLFELNSTDEELRALHRLRTKPLLHHSF